MPYDVVIVGGGAAGSILASRLSEDPDRTVCLIEAGKDYRTIEELPVGVRTHRFFRGLTIAADGNSNDPALVGFPDWGYRARATDLQPSALLPRGKVIGGSSSVNGAVWFHPLREDLDEWAAAGNPSWSYETCRSLLTKIERDIDYPEASYHGHDGPIPIERAKPNDWAPLNWAFYEACLARGYADCPDFNAPDTDGVGPIPVNLHNHIRYSAAIGYLLPVRERPNLTVLGEAMAIRLCLDGVRARGVLLRTPDGEKIVEGSEILLAAGAIGTPQLLMLSGIGPADQLSALGISPLVDLAGVGRNLRDHPVLRVSWEASREVVPPTAGPSTTGQVGLRGTTPGSTTTNDMRLMSYAAQGPNRFGIPFSLMRADSAGSVTLASTEPDVAPVVDLAHLDEPSDRDRMRAMLEVATEIGEDTAFNGLRGRRLVPSAAEYTDDKAMTEWMLRTVITGHHASGTCKMGPDSDPTTVVAQDGRVHGTKGLRVVDASVMVDCPRVNINATTMLIAEKMAEFVIG